jgi:adenine-specific DNA-methyltransferase
LLIHSENFQALNLIKERFEQQIRATYIDPPYNTVHSEIIYKNQYKHSSWLSLIANVASVTPKFWLKTFSFGLAIDDYEFVNLAALLDGLFPNLERSIVVINHHPQGAGGRLSRTHEYLILCSPSNAPSYLGKPKDDYLEERSFMRSGTAENNYRYGRWKSFYALLLDPTKNIIVDAEEPIPLSEEYTKSKTVDGYRRIYPINSRGEERVWRSSFVTGKKRAQDGELIVSDSGTVYQTIDHDGKRETLFSNWTDKKFNAGIHGSNILGSLGLGGLFDYPKSIFTVETALWAQTYGDYQAIVLDYFAGSGTTGHAVVNLNRNDNGKRKYILVEMGDYFNTVLKPRISKVVYSENWKDGKPSTRDTGISHCFKY